MVAFFLLLLLLLLECLALTAWICAWLLLTDYWGGRPGIADLWNAKARVRGRSGVFKVSEGYPADK